MASLAKQITQYIDQKLRSGKMEAEVMKPASNEAIRLTKRNTRKGRGFADYDFGNYAESTDKQGPVRFRDTGAAVNSLFGQETKNRSEVTFGNKNQILDYHQDGTGRNPKRELFPEEAEPKGATVEEFTKFIETKLELYLNGP